MANNNSDDQEWSCKRHEITHQEARSVLEAQQAIISDLDDKAMRTVRITVLLVGIVISVVEVGVGDISLNGPTASVGSAFLLISIIAGMATYSESDLYLGVGNEYLLQLKDGSFNDYPNAFWEDHLLVQYSGWIEENARDIRWNSILLQITQGTLAIGLTCITLAIAL